MTFDGFYFSATGVSSYVFYHGNERVCSVSRHSLPNFPVDITVGGITYSFSRKESNEYGFLSPNGKEAACLYHWDQYHFSLVVSDPSSVGEAGEGATGGAGKIQKSVSLTGRIIKSRLHKSILYTGIDDEPFGIIECGYSMLIKREEFGERFPRRYVATVSGDMPALALAVPFLGIKGIEIA